VGAEEKNIETPQELLDLLERGEEYKRYGATGTNSLDVFKFSISIYSMYCYGATGKNSLHIFKFSMSIYCYGATGTYSLDIFKFSISVFSIYCYGATSTKSLQVLNNTLTFIKCTRTLTCENLWQP